MNENLDIEDSNSDFYKLSVKPEWSCNGKKFCFLTICFSLLISTFINILYIWNLSTNLNNIIDNSFMFSGIIMILSLLMPFVNLCFPLAMVKKCYAIVSKGHRNIFYKRDLYWSFCQMVIYSLVVLATYCLVVMSFLPITIILIVIVAIRTIIKIF